MKCPIFDLAGRICVYPHGHTGPHYMALPEEIPKAAPRYDRLRPGVTEDDVKAILLAALVCVTMISLLVSLFHHG